MIRRFIKRNELALLFMLYITVCIPLIVWGAQQTIVQGDTFGESFTKSNANDTEQYAHIANTSNPHTVTPAQLSLEIGTDVQAWDAFLDDIGALTDPGADRILFWDDSGTLIDWLILGTGLSITDKTINATGGGASPLTTKGDIYGYTTTDARLPVGANDTTLMADSAEATGLDWKTPTEVKTALSLNAVDNTADSDKPISLATDAALDLKGDLAGTNVWTGTNTFSGTLNIGNINYNAALGTDDTYSGQGITGLDAGEAIAQWDMVYFDATAGEYLIADADAAGKWPAWGMAVEAGTDGNPLVIVQGGMVRNDAWTWSAANVPLYLSDTPGGLTETAPSTDGDGIQPVAVTVSADIIRLNVDPIFGYGESN